MTRRFVLMIALAALPLVACEPSGGKTSVPADAQTTVVSLQDIDCGSCGTKMVDDLTARPEVYAAQFDLKTAEVTIQHQPGALDIAAVQAIAKGHGFSAVEGAGQGSYQPSGEFASSLDVQQIAAGDDAVQLEDHLVPGKVTVFDFYALWCKPCREIDAHMAVVLGTHGDVALRKLDVVDWDSGIAKQHLTEVRDLPYLVVYGKDGRQVGTVSGLKIPELDDAIERGRR